MDFWTKDYILMQVANFLQVFLRVVLKIGLYFASSTDINCSYILSKLHDGTDNRIGKSAPSILRKWRLWTHYGLLEPRSNLPPHERTRIFFSRFLFFLVRCSPFSCNFTHSHYYLIRLKSFVLVRTEVCMRECVKIHYIRKETCVELTFSSEKQAMTYHKTA